ncbi:MAG: hypothetical protein ACLFQB_12700 [Chitinispirillaceae bacterium]
MNLKCIRFLFLAVLCSITVLYAGFPDITVSQTNPDAMFSSIQAAVDAAQPGMIIEIMDAEVYEEQVTVDSTKQGITIRSANPLSRSKPVIRWQDTENTHPHTYEETQPPDETINYNRNGALRVVSANGVTLDGICIDGGGAYPFAYSNVWGGRQEQFHGNAAICLFASRDAQIRNCEVRKAYYGIYVNDRILKPFSNPVDPPPPDDITQYGRMGKHLIEHSRIHSNSWGFFFESIWDMSTNVRYNLIYDNYHTEETLLAISVLPGKEHQPGGAFLFKEIEPTPLAVYNNTFWHNYLIFAGQMKPGSQHLIFNNIYGKPKYYWDQGYPGGLYTNSSQAMDGISYQYRSKNSLYSSQKEAPVSETRKHYVPCADSQEVTAVCQLRISEGISDDYIAPEGETVDFQCPDGSVYTIDADWAKRPGALISDISSFPQEAQMRWLETEELFQSTDPESLDFLHPDWDDPLVKQFIKNAGWQEIGIRNSDGSVADIGAVSSCEENSGNMIQASLAKAVVDRNSKATLVLDIEDHDNTLRNLNIKYLRWVYRIPIQSASSFGSTIPILSENDMFDIDISEFEISAGSNTITFPVPEIDLHQMYDYERGFFEMVIEGESTTGENLSSSVCFQPYRFDNHKTVVEIRDNNGNKLDSVRAGQQVNLFLKPIVIGIEEEVYSDTIDTVEVKLLSDASANLYDARTDQPLRIEGGFQGELVIPVYFAYAGMENVKVTAEDHEIVDNQVLSFPGFSDEIRVLPGPADKVRFIRPIPKSMAGARPPVISPGEKYEVIVQVSDRFDNLVKDSANVSITSLAPAIGDITDTSALSDKSGRARFTAEVIYGKYGEIFDMVATLDANGASDTGALRCGRVRDRLMIFYNDSEMENRCIEPEMKLGAELNTRIPVRITALRGDTVLTERNTEFTMEATEGIRLYASRDTSENQTTFTLAEGQITIWLESGVEVENGFISVTPTIENIHSATREEVYIGVSSPVVRNNLNTRKPAYNLVLYDLRGRMVGRMESLKRNGNMNLLRKRFPAGTYVIRTVLEGEVIETRKRLIGR